VLVEVGSLGVEIRKDGDRVARPDTRDGVASSVLHRRHHEVGAALGTEDSCGVECAPEAFKGRAAITSQPALVVEVIDSDKPPSSGVIHGEPVVTAEALSDVVQASDIQVPVCDERVGQLMFVESLGQRPHSPQDMTPDHFAGGVICFDARPVAVLPGHKLPF